MIYILFKRTEHKIRENVVDWEITVPDWPSGGLYTQQSVKILVIHQTDITFRFPCSLFSVHDMINCHSSSISEEIYRNFKVSG